MLTLAMLGAVLPIVTLAVTGVPALSVSRGVTVQVTSSPPEKPDEMEAVVPMVVAPTVHS